MARRRRPNQKPSPIMMASTAMPPTTPPAMGPALLFLSSPSEAPEFDPELVPVIVAVGLDPEAVVLLGGGAV